MAKKITLPLTDEAIKDLKAGDSVLITGSMLTGRDAAHKRLFELIEKGEKLPVDLSGEVIYYVGPAPAKPGHAVGPAGPTSSYRMDKYTPALLEHLWPSSLSFVVHPEDSFSAYGLSGHFYIRN